MTTQKQKELLELAVYQRRLHRNPCLKYLFFELTDKCNLNCLHCGSRCTNDNDLFLPFQSILMVLHEVKDEFGSEGIMICLTGGEPLLHPDVFRTVKAARDLGFAVGMTTNGTLIKRREAFLLRAAGLNTVAVSLDGLPEDHNMLRCNKVAFDNTVSGIRHLKDVGIEPQIISVIHKQNLNKLEKMFSLLKELEIYSWRIVNIDPIGRAALNKELLLDHKDMKTLLDFIRSKRNDRNQTMDITYGCSHFLGYDFEKTVRDFYFQCGAGTQVASIMANGDIGACLDIVRDPKLIQGNIYRDHFVDIWEKEFQEFRADRSDSCSICKTCGYKAVCRGDSAHTWDYERNEPLYCIKKLKEVRDNELRNQN